MCQFVAVSKHLLLCRYECQKFGFWGVFLAGRFCVYITQMNFLFYRFSSFFHPFVFRLFLPLFPSCFVLFYLIYFTTFLLFLPCLILSYFTAFRPFFVLFLFCSFVPDSCYLSYCILCLLSAGAGWCHF